MHMAHSKIAISEDHLAAIKKASHEILQEATSFLQEIVRIDTTNPPGLNYRKVANFIKDKLDSLGYQTSLLEVAASDLPTLAPHDSQRNERVNVIGRLPSSSNDPTLVTARSGQSRQKVLHFNGHTDVVPIGDPETWSEDPFGANIVERDGQKVIIGRGVSDMKGGIAAQIFAVEAIRRAGLKLKGTVEQSGVVDEESTGVRNAGAGWLVEQGHVSSDTHDGVVITEPLNVENVCCGHRGTIWGTITFKGIASHGSTPQRGINALENACRFVVEAKKEIDPLLEGKFDDRVVPPEARQSSLTFTVLQSGANTNSVPDRAVLTFDRRLVSTETVSEGREQIQSVLARLSKEIGPEKFKYSYHENYHTDPVWVDEDGELASIWRGSVESVLGKTAGIVCSPGTDDQRFFVRGGIEQTIVYGPGNIRNVHNKDEMLALEDLRTAIEVMAIGTAQFLGVE